MGFKTADLCDEFSKELVICKQPFTSFDKNTAFSGPISTFKVLEDNVLVKEALQTIPEKNVLVVDGVVCRNCALIGDCLAVIAVERGLAGSIMYCSVLDTSDLRDMEVCILA